MRLAFEVERVVKQLVKHHLGKPDFVVFEQMRQQRVIEPTQGTERRRSAQVGIVAVGLQTLDFLFCVRFREVSFVGHLPTIKNHQV